MVRKQAKKEENKPPHPIVEVGKDTRFKPSDPRIRPGPGRPPNWWKDLLAQYEQRAVELLGQALNHGSWASRRQAATDILDRLHGRPTQPLVQTTHDAELLKHATRQELEEYLAFVRTLRERHAAGSAPVD